MSIESLVQKIVADTRRESTEIEQQASVEVKQYEAETEEEVQRIVDASKQRAARLAQERKDRMISMAELEFRKEILLVKQQMIEEAINRAIEQIRSLSTEAYGDFLIHLILQAEPVGDEEIVLNRRDRERFQNGWLDQVNRRLVEKKKQGAMRMDEETRPIQGGVILKKGRKETNCSLESVIFSKRSSLEATVAEILFKDDA